MSWGRLSMGTVSGGVGYPGIGYPEGRVSGGVRYNPPDIPQPPTTKKRILLDWFFAYHVGAANLSRFSKYQNIDNVDISDISVTF